MKSSRKKTADTSYYGSLSCEKPIRSLAQDLMVEQEKNIYQQLKEMEDRLKRHVTECKREITKLLQKEKNNG